MGILEAETSTKLTRTTAHRQYDRRAFGVVLLDHLVPIVLHIPKPGRPAYPAILNFGGVHHKQPGYNSLGVRKKCCRKVILFNVIHYTKCYLTADHVDGPYTYNYCRQCGAKLKDPCGHIVQVNQVRSYNVDRFIYRAPAVLQSPGSGELLSWQKENC